jgi:sarcosine oxidase, subunit beta
MVAEQPRTADVVVVGGGIVGASALYHLAAAGCRDAVLVERDTLGSGSTGAAAGGIRAQFSDELNIRIALESIARFGRFSDEIGADVGFRQCGYLFLVQVEDMASFSASVALQQSLGVPSRMLTRAEAASLVPQLHVDDLAGASYDPLDGSADPGAAVQGYASAARRLGARVLQDTAVLRIVVGPDGGSVVGVETPRGTIAAPTVILAAGVWSRELAIGIGVDIPVRAGRRYGFQTAGDDPLPADLPLTIDFTTGFYMHRERRGLLLGGPWPTLEGLAPVAVHRVPELGEIPIRRGWSGDYEMSPDHNAIVGATARPRGLLYATGFSGHGFQQGPVVGDYLAAVALGREPVIDLSPFSLDRFANHQLRGEVNVV